MGRLDHLEYRRDNWLWWVSPLPRVSIAKVLIAGGLFLYVSSLQHFFADSELLIEWCIQIDTLFACALATGAAWAQRVL
jgi:hypothetical protein